jgi:hypothetical protein
VELPSGSSRAFRQDGLVLAVWCNKHVDHVADLAGEIERAELRLVLALAPAKSTI